MAEKSRPSDAIFLHKLGETYLLQHWESLTSDQAEALFKFLIRQFVAEGFAVGSGQEHDWMRVFGDRNETYPDLDILFRRDQDSLFRALGPDRKKALGKLRTILRRFDRESGLRITIQQFQEPST